VLSWLKKEITMTHRFILLLVLVCTGALFGCASEDLVPSQQSVQMRKINVISVHATTATLTENTRFSWQRELLVAGDNGHNYEAKIPTLKSQIEAYFNQRGYVFTQTLSDANYSLEAVVLLEGHQDVDAAENSDLLFGLDPGMSPSKEFGMGTLLVGIKDTKTGELVWRGAVQILTGGSLSDEARMAKIDNAIQLLLEGFFDA
jgi:hypothetical protein